MRPVRLRTRLVLLVAIGVLPALAGLGYDQWRDRAHAQQQTLDDTLRLAQLAATQTAAMVDGAQRLLQTLSHVPGLDDPKECSGVLLRVLREHPGYLNIGVVQPNGFVSCSSSPETVSLRLGDRPWFDRSIQTRHAVVSDYQVGRITGTPDIVIAQPVFDDSGRLLSVLAAAVELRQFSRILANVRLPAGATLTMFDRARTILGRQPEPERWTGKQVPEQAIGQLMAGAREDIVETRGVDGVERVYVTVPVDLAFDADLYIGMGIPRAVVFAEVDRRLYSALWLMVLSALAVVVAGLVGGHTFIIQPVNAMRTVADRLAAGDFAARASMPGGVAELRSLGDAMDSMAVALERRQREAEASASQSRLLFDANPQPMWVFDVETLEFLDVNDAAVRKYGYSRTEFLSMRLPDIRREEDVPHLRQHLDSSRGAEGETHGWRHRLKSGEIIEVDISWHALMLNGRRARLVLAQDVTPRRRAEEALAERARISALTADVGIALNQPEDVRQCLQGCASALVRHLDAALARIWILNVTTGMLELQASAGLSTHIDREDRAILVGESNIGRIALDCKPMVTNQMIGESNADDQDWAARERIVAFAGHPLMAEGRLVGVMAMFARHPLPTSVTTALSAVADHLALGLARYQAETERRLLAAVVEDSDDAIVVKRLDGTILTWNDGAERLYGYTASEVVGQPVTVIAPPERAAEIWSLIERIGRGEHLTHVETVRRRKDGTLLTVSQSLSPIRDVTGQIVGVSSITRDIGARQRAETALRLSEERFRRIAETVAEVFWIADVDMAQIVYISPAYERIWGRSRQSLYHDPRSLIDAIHPEDRPRALERLIIQKNGQPFEHEYRVVRPDGEIRWIWDRGFPVHDGDGSVTQYVGAAQDITDRKRADDRLRLLARAIESSNDMISVTDVNDRITFVNNAFLRTYGYTLEEVLGQPPAIVQAPGNPPEKIAEILRETLDGGWHGELINRRKDGSELCIFLHTSLIRSDEDEIVGLLGVARDITERLNAQRALEDTETRMRFALEAAHVGVWEADLRTGAAYWSDTCETLHGLAPGTFAKTLDAFTACVHADDRAEVRQEIDRAVAEHRNANLEYRTIWPDGRERRISTSGHFFYDEHGAPTRGAGIMVDITERRLLEDQFRQAQKMEAVGQLAGGIAHDFNNILTAILGYAELIGAELPPDDDRKADVDEVAKAARRAATLTQQLLAFSRKQILMPRVLHLGDVVSDLAPMLRRLIGETIVLRSVVGNRGHVKADAGQIEQILMNLAVNARDAMPGGGRLTIETSDVVLDNTFAAQHPAVRPGSYVMLSISDTGTGMDEATRKRVFEPFFTTKPKGRGTGLGLATTYGIVQQSNGHIWVYSEVGAGTTFKICLPRTEEVPPDPTAPAVDPHAFRGTETILVVEDETLVREFVTRVLAGYGYSTHAMEDPAQALEFVSQFDGALQLVLTDVVLPTMSGREMAAQLLQRRPDARILYMSGYADDAIVHGGMLDADTWFISKPFSGEALVRRVRDVLDAQPV